MPAAPEHRVRGGSAAARALGRLAALSVARPRTVLTAAVAVALLSLAWAALHLELRTSNLDLIDPEVPAVERFRDLARSFGTPNMLVVVLEGEDGSELRGTVERLTPLLAGVEGTRAVIGRLPGNPGALLRFGVDPWFRSTPGDDGGELYFLFVQPDDPESRAQTIGPWVEGVRRVLEEAGLRGPGSGPGAGPGAGGVRAGLTGLPQYAVDDRDAVRRDLALLSPVSFVLILALFAVAFAALRRPLAAMAALSVAVAWTLGVVAVWPGHLTLLSAFFGTILFGLGVDFGIHVVDRLEELLAAGGGDPPAGSEAAAVVAAVHGLGPALTTAALTTASAFGVMTLSGFRGFAELGAVAAVGVPLCLLAVATVLPALVVLLPGSAAARRRPLRRRLGGALVRLQSPVLALLLAGCAAVGPLLLRPGFDADYLNLEPRGSEAVRWEREMVSRSPYSPQFAAFVTGSRAQARALAERLAADPTVGRVHSAADLELLAAAGGASEQELAPLRSRFVGADGRFAVYAYPREDVWREAAGERFLAHMKAIDPEVTGLPLLGRVMIERSRRALAVTGLLAAAVIALWVLLDLRDPLLALLALVPTLLGAGAMLALMRIAGVSFNPLDVMALPAVLGIAVDDGVHLVHRFLAEEGDLEATLRGTGRSVVLTSLTSVAAFGVLAAASHRGLASFGAAAALGVTSALAVSVLVLPQALRWWGRRDQAAGLSAGDRNGPHELYVQRTGCTSGTTSCSSSERRGS